MKRPRSLVALAVLIAAALIPVPEALAQAKKLDPVALRLSWIASGQFAMYVYGIKKGIYEREGIDLTVKEDRAEIDRLVSWEASLLSSANRQADWPIEPCPEILARTAGKRPVTDDNMGSEWRYFLGIE